MFLCLSQDLQAGNKISKLCVADESCDHKSLSFLKAQTRHTTKKQGWIGPVLFVFWFWCLYYFKITNSSK